MNERRNSEKNLNNITNLHIVIEPLISNLYAYQRDFDIYKDKIIKFEIKNKNTKNRLNQMRIHVLFLIILKKENNIKA